MASGKEIRTKIASVKSTQKITKAMEMVGRVEAAPHAAAHGRLAAVRGAHPNRDRPFVEVNPDYRMYCGARGEALFGVHRHQGPSCLCGSVNVNMFREVLRDLRKWRDQGVETDLCLVVGIAYFRRLNVYVVAATSHLGEQPSQGPHRRDHGDDLEHTPPGQDRSSVLRARVVNTMSQQPTISQLLPVEAIDKEVLQQHWDLHLRT